jgi:hypothetical protein
MTATNGNPDEFIFEAEPQAENGEVYDDESEEEEDWVEDAPKPPTSPKPRRGRRRK